MLPGLDNAPLIWRRLAGAIGSRVIGFLAAGSGRVRPVEDKLREVVSVTDYPGTFDGAADDTAAATAALAVANWVYVPQGAVLKVSAGLDYWRFFGPGQVFEDGIEWQLNPFPQYAGTLKNYKARTWGNREDACGVSLAINQTSEQTRETAQVLGTTTAGMATTYTDRDHVGLYGQANSFISDETSSATTYTATTLTDATTVAALIAATKLRRGMVIDTKHGTPYTGRIRSWSGNSITVDGWYQRGTGTLGTPANGTGATINPNTKIWCMNWNLLLTGNSSNNAAQKGTGYELDIGCDPSTSGQEVWGFDIVTLYGKPEMHYQSRGSATYGYYRAAGADYAYVSQTNAVAFESRDSASYDFSAVVGGLRKWAISGGVLTRDYRKTTFTASSDYTVLDTDAVVVAVTGGAIVRLPAAGAGMANRCVTVSAPAGVTLKAPDGTTLRTIAAGSQWVAACDGSFWY